MKSTADAFDLEWRARFERYGRAHRRDAAVSGWSEAGLLRRLSQFRALLPELALPSAARVLDLGCGAGTYVRLLTALGYRTVGLDYSLPSLSRASSGDGGRYAAGDAYALPFAAATFDLVIAIGIIQAVARPEHAIDEMRRVLRPDGTLVIEVLNAWAISALARRCVDRLAGRRPRLRRYTAAQAQRWLEERGLRLVRRLEIYLPPRRLPAAAAVLDFGPVAALLGGCPGLAAAIAQSFLFVARSDAPGARSPAP